MLQDITKMTNKTTNEFNKEMTEKAGQQINNKREKVKSEKLSFRLKNNNATTLKGGVKAVSKSVNVEVLKKDYKNKLDVDFDLIKELINENTKDQKTANELCFIASDFENNAIRKVARETLKELEF